MIPLMFPFLWTSGVQAAIEVAILGPIHVVSAQVIVHALSTSE